MVSTTFSFTSAILGECIFFHFLFGLSLVMALTGVALLDEAIKQNALH